MPDEYTDDYEVYNADDGSFIGTVELPENADASQMPDFIEINGIYYRAEK